jgi:molybdopterin/thiamine biosynthesis adenylyltransferase
LFNYLLEDYFHSTADVINAVTKIKNSTAMIVGLGAVGSFLSLYLAKFGICSLILVDNDIVEISNLHRQAFFEIDLGKSKAQQLRHQILEINPEADVKIIEKSLDESFFEQQELPEKLDLIINCADKPSVDFTSRIIAKFAMKNRIPHIVGGGYNLHLTLIGQTIIPYQTACFNCFEKTLEEMNNAELENVKKLHRENRKLGSFSPLSGIAASMAAFDAFKILAGAEKFVQQSNKRIEFKTRERKFNILDIPRNPDCSWCGTENFQNILE